MGVLWPLLTKNFSKLWPMRKKALSTEFGRGGIKRIFTIPYAERPEICRPKYSQNPLDGRPNEAHYAFLRPGQIHLANFRAAGRIKDMVPLNANLFTQHLTDGVPQVKISKSSNS